MKTILLHGHAGPNPWKVALVLEELKLPYQMKIWATTDQKKPPFTTTLNPNGFTPVLEDPNEDVVLWESGAIIEYLLETYDNQNHFMSFPLSEIKNRGLLRQYHFMQATSQGPNLSAAFHFMRVIPIPEARKRFIDESIRVLRVLDGALEKKEWLVGGKCSAADLAFLPYTWSMPLIMADDKPDLAEDFPNVGAWLKRMSARETVQKVASERAAVFAASTAATPAPK